MKQVEASAKTREEAIQNALKDLGVEMYEVDKIEVLDEGSKGLFGFGARPVKVRLVVENMPDEPQREERPRRNNNRGRGGERNQSRESRGERSERSGNRNEGRGERKERSGNAEARGERNGEREERGRGRGDKSRNERGNRNRNARTEESNEATKGNEGGNSTPNESRGRNRNDKEVSPSRGARNRGRKREDRPEGEERQERPQRRERPAAEESTAPVSGEEPTVDGIAADAIEPITDAQGNEAAALLEEIISNMGIEAKAAFTRSEDGSARLNVTSEDSAILIGRKGRNLSAMQYLINRMISRGDTNESSERLVVDVEGYVDRRRETLQDMARSMAERAKESNRNMRLKPLSPQERRIVHLTLQDDEDIRTFSLGESLYRSVVISPKGAAQPDRNRSSRGGRGGRGRRRGGRDRNQEQRSGRNRPAEQDVDAGTFGD